MFIHPSGQRGLIPGEITALLLTIQKTSFNIHPSFALYGSYTVVNMVDLHSHFFHLVTKTFEILFEKIAPEVYSGGLDEKVGP